MQFAQISAANIRSESGRGKNAVTDLLSGSHFLQAMEVRSGWEVDETTFGFTPTTATSTAPKRSINSNFSDQTRAVPDKVWTTQAIHGDSVVTDRTFLRDYELGLRDFDKNFLKDVKKRLKDFGYNYEAKVFNGSGDSGEFKGLATLLTGTDLPGYEDANRVINAKTAAGVSGDSFDISGTTNQKKLLEVLKTNIRLVDNPNMILMNRSMQARLETAANEVHKFTTTVNEFGRPIVLYNGIEIVVVNDAAITLAEDDDAVSPATNTTSIYILSVAESNCSLVTNSGLEWWDWNHIDNADKGKEKWEIGGAWKIENPNAVLRIRNIKL